MRAIKNIEVKINQLSPGLIGDLDLYLDYLINKRVVHKPKKLKQDWAGGLKDIILPALLICVISVSYSQSTRFETGIEAGGGSRRLYGNRTIIDTHDPVVNGGFGLFLQYHLSNKFSIRTAVGYELKGSVVREFMMDIYYPFYVRKRIEEVLTNLNYLSIPLLARMNFGHKAKFYINAGPYFAYLLSATKYYYYNAYNLTDKKTNDIRNFSRYDVGFSIEPGFAFPIGKSFRFSTSFRYSLGLVDIGTSSKHTLKTSSGLLLVGIGYRIK